MSHSCLYLSSFFSFSSSPPLLHAMPQERSLLPFLASDSRLLPTFSSRSSSSSLQLISFFLCSLVIWRFILGVGIGGTYPLTAVYAGEMQDERSMGRTRRVALSISIQIIGNILAPVLMFVVLLLLGSENVTLNQTSTEAAWRFLLGVGAVPALFALREIMYSQESSEFLSIRATGFRSRLSDVLRTLSTDMKIRQRFIGAAGGWMCFDICFFGVAIFLPHIIHDLIDKDDHGEGFLLLNSAVSALINCIAIPAVLLSMRLVSDEGLGRKNLQIVSFFLIMVAYALLMFFFSPLRSIQATTSVIFMFLSLFFCLNFGAGMTTYILPQVALLSTCPFPLMPSRPLPLSFLLLFLPLQPKRFILPAASLRPLTTAAGVVPPGGSIYPEWHGGSGREDWSHRGYFNLRA
eukprot:758865-Hanusia_phi.AAC.1